MGFSKRRHPTQPNRGPHLELALGSKLIGQAAHHVPRGMNRPSREGFVHVFLCWMDYGDRVAAITQVIGVFIDNFVPARRNSGCAGQNKCDPHLIQAAPVSSRLYTGKELNTGFTPPRHQRGSSLGPKQGFLDQFAEDVPGQDVGFLDARCLIAGNADAVIDSAAQLPTASSGQTHCD